MRGRPLNVSAIGRAAGFVLVAAAIIAAVVHFHREGISRPPPMPLAAPSADPLAAALSHCQALGTAAEGDVTCRAAWAENRRRFFNDQPASEGR